MTSHKILLALSVLIALVNCSTANNFTETEKERVVKRYDSSLYFNGPYIPSYYAGYDDPSIGKFTFETIFLQL